MAINTATGAPEFDTENYDPDMPVYADPEVGFTERQIETQSPEQYIDPSKATVEGRTTGLLRSGNPLLQRAQGLAVEKGNQRGLLNTRGTVLAGTTAVIDQARQIATPDAALYGDMSKMQMKADQDAGLNTQIAGYELDKEKARGKITGALTTQEQAGQVEIQKQSDAAQMQRIEVDSYWKERINDVTLDSKEKESLLRVSAALGGELTGNIERILRDTNISDKEVAIEAVMTQYRTQMNTAAALIDLELVWGTPEDEV